MTLPSGPEQIIEPGSTIPSSLINAIQLGEVQLHERLDALEHQLCFVPLQYGRAATGNASIGTAAKWSWIGSTSVVIPFMVYGRKLTHVKLRYSRAGGTMTANVMRNTEIGTTTSIANYVDSSGIDYTFVLSEIDTRYYSYQVTVQMTTSGAELLSLEIGTV